MRRVKLFLKAHKEALRAAWPFDFPYPSGKGSSGRGQGKRASQRGQLVFEFLLLLVLSVTIATMISKQMVSRDPDQPGFLVSAWHGISVAIGNDIID